MGFDLLIFTKRVMDLFSFKSRHWFQEDWPPSAFGFFRGAFR